MAEVVLQNNIEFSPPLDPGIRRYVEILVRGGIETYESCQGGEGHCYPEPTIRFHGDMSEGFKAFDIARKHALPVSSFQRIWVVIDGEPVGPKWEMVFHRMSADG